MKKGGDNYKIYKIIKKINLKEIITITIYSKYNTTIIINKILFKF